MITKKITRSMQLKLLRLIYEDYLEEHGEGVRKLGQFGVLITAHDMYIPRMPELMEVEGTLARPLFSDVLSELKTQGYLRWDEASKYYLTTEGYNFVRKGLYGRFVDYLNRNPGLAIPISVVSLLLSVLAISLTD